MMRPLCPVCKTSIPENVTFERHITEWRKREENGRTCIRCSKVFLKLQYLKRHMKIKHGIESDFQRWQSNWNWIKINKLYKKLDVEEKYCYHDPEIELCALLLKVWSFWWYKQN
jgi:hypothetical protein